LDAAIAGILSLDPVGLRTAQVLRDTFDQLYGGGRTGRYRWDQLYRIERTKGGKLVEINLQREFRFQDGASLHYHIAGVDVDCRYSQALGGWMIPPEAHDNLCLLLWADDDRSQWSMGMVRAAVDRLNTAGNRDREATLNQEGRAAITWLFNHAPLPRNVLLQLDSATVQRVMSQNSGQKRINELFRSTLGKLVGRGVVATVAQQDDYMKRVRANGGARTALKPEGIVILGHYSSHAAIARAFGVPVPARGDSVPVRLSPAKHPAPGVAPISGSLWRVAGPADPPVTAPDLPDI
jgi:hypothetical protein